jgi:hypothetical protein
MSFRSTFVAATVGAVWDRAYFVDSRKARGHRPRLQNDTNAGTVTVKGGANHAFRLRVPNSKGFFWWAACLGEAGSPRGTKDRGWQD